MTDSRFLAALAAAFPTLASAHDLLETAGLPAARLLPAGAAVSAESLWLGVVRELENGVVDGGLEALRASALARYPGNSAFLVPASDRSVPAVESARLEEELETAYRHRADADSPADAKRWNAEILKLRRRLRDRVLRKGDELGAEGRFQLEEILGSGGFGEVWKAYDVGERRMVALKVLHSQYARDHSRRERFLRGARKMAELEHPGIVRVLGESVDGEDCFFAMEYLSGGDLRRAVFERRISCEDALERVLEVGDALAYAHACGLVHRDVKPANILLTPDGRAKLTDFDLVRAADTTGGTRTQGLGSFLYAAPELMMSAKDAGEPADVYGLAMTLAFVLYGGDIPPSALWATDMFLKELDVTEGVREILAKGLAKDPSDRIVRLADFCAEVRAPSKIRDSGFVQSSRDVTRDPEVGLGDLFKWVDTPCDGRVSLWRNIPAGEFLMGSPEGEEGHWESEGPLHEVRIRQAFQMMAIPVTNAMYRAFDPAFEPERWVGITESALALHPVVNVSWEDTQRFIRWLDEKIRGVRLPTEAEWEYACRAGTSTRYWSGDLEADLEKVGWFKGNSGGRTHRVGEKIANDWGLYDMHGNVWEWCADGLRIYRSQTKTDPVGPKALGEDRVVRGGSWSDVAQDVRAAYRHRNAPLYRWNQRGFRLAKG